METTQDRTLQLFISKIDLDYAYEQMKSSKETSRQCVFAITGAKFSGYYRFKKGFTESPTSLQFSRRKKTEHWNTAHRHG